MNLSNMFKKSGFPSIKMSGNEREANIPEGLYRKCAKCGGFILADDVRKGNNVCPKCGGYFRLSARKRIRMVADEGSFEEWDRELIGQNPMEYPEYEEKLKSYQDKTGIQEAIIIGKAKINGMDMVVGSCDSRFWMASMGWAVGEKITRAVERATEEKLPIILFICSGGARMQEGITSLMQMAKTSAALKRHSDVGLLYIPVLTDPTTGGVTASFAMLGDIILAEPNALIGFAGSRVIEQTIRQKLPNGFQRSEFLLDHGFIDGIIERNEMKEMLSRIVNMHQRKEEIPIQKEIVEQERAASEENRTQMEKRILSAWERVQLSRKNERPVGSDYIQELFTEFTEFHGDRYYADDKAIIGGIARFHGQPVTVIAQAKGRNTKENVQRNFGMPSPEGYRKVLRLMKQAEKFHRPIICFVDTPGAFCGIEAEERGQGEAIAKNLSEMSSLKVPILSVVIGEGGSGGALAMAVADEVWMLENSVYSILSPEGFASILWKDSSKAKEAAEVMKLTAADLYQAGVVEKIIEEPENYSKQNLKVVMSRLDLEIRDFLRFYEAMTGQELTEHRYNRFRRM